MSLGGPGFTYTKDRVKRKRKKGDCIDSGIECSGIDCNNECVRKINLCITDSFKMQKCSPL